MPLKRTQMSKIPSKTPEMTDKEYSEILLEYCKNLEDNLDHELHNKAHAMVELVKAALEIHNLKPFVSEMQFDASKRISKHICNASILLGEN